MDACNQAPLLLPKMQDQILLMLISRMWLGAWVCLFCISRRLIRRKWTVTYQCQYFMINSSLSECDHQLETWNAEPEIGTEGSSQIRRKPLVDQYRSGLGPPIVSGSGYWIGQELNRPIFAVHTQTAGELPGHIDNTCCEDSWRCIAFCVGRPAKTHLWP